MKGYPKPMKEEKVKCLWTDVLSACERLRDMSTWSVLHERLRVRQGDVVCSSAFARMCVKDCLWTDV
jgi:hypothetical protein